MDRSVYSSGPREAPTKVADPRLSLLGTWQLTVGGRAQHLPLGAQKLIAFLSLRGRSDRAHLVGALWPDASEEHAHGSLRSLLWRMRKTRLGLLDATDSCVALSDRVRVDVTDVIDDSTISIRGGVPDLDGTLPAHLLDGELLPGWYDDWVLIERQRIRQLRLHALEALALTLARKGCFALGLEAALAAVRAEPLRESAHRTVIDVHLLEGNVVEALRQADYCRRLLREELGLDPSPLLLATLPACATHQRLHQERSWSSSIA
ncbi:MAG TPA: BTAD domain-containing putative transcriptional regulator [Nocardioidaceae bacterium]|jgi:DNA-binding SARP family transcriptional activator